MNFRPRTIMLNLLLLACLLAGFLPLQPVQAQAEGAYFTAREGDTLTDVARYFHATNYSLIVLNNIANPDVLLPGRKLYIPNFDDLEGEIIITPLAVGENAHTLQRLLRLGNNAFTRLNFLTAPESLYAGRNVFTLKRDQVEQTRLQLTNGINTAELAVQTGTNPWLPALYNELRAPWALLQNDTLFLPGSTPPAGPGYLPGFTALTVNPVPLEQGKTTVITAAPSAGASLTGDLLGYPLHFQPGSSAAFTALQGIPRMAKPGRAVMLLTATTPDGRSFSQQPNLLLRLVDYGYDSPLEVADNVVDPAITEPESAGLMALLTDAPADRLWAAPFAIPVPTPERVTSKFGRLRSYNGSSYEYFHSGIDYAGSDETPILASAPGIVIFTGEWVVRGNVTILSHGWGVYTGYWHQSRIDVKVGDRVETGQTIGMVGNTGRVTGPHLHFDLIVGSVEVDPEDWLKGLYTDL